MDRHASQPGGSTTREDARATTIAEPGLARHDAGPIATTLTTPVPAAAVVERLSELSKRGRLAGFRVIEPAGAGRAIVRVLAFARVYDHELIIRIDPAAEGSRLSFELRLLRKTPSIAGAIIVLTVFPGLWLTDSMLSTYFDWYRIETWWWYLPLVALMLPFMWKQYQASRAEAVRDAAETISKLDRLLNHRPV